MFILWNISGVNKGGKYFFNLVFLNIIKFVIII